METQAKKPGVLLGIIVGMAASLSAFFTLLAPLAPAFTVYLGLAGGVVPLFLALAVSGVGLYLFAGVTGLYLFALIGAATLVLLLMMKRQAPWFDTILFTSFTIIAALYATYCLPDILAGRGAFDTVKEVFASSWEMYAAQMAATGSLLGQDATQNYEAIGRMVLAELPATFPFSLCVMGCCFGFGDMLIARALCRRQGVSLRPMTRFTLWRLPKGYMLGVLVLWIGSALCTYREMANADAIALCCAAIACIPLCMQGACTITFVFKLRQARAGLYVPFLLLMLFTFPYCTVALALFGAVEQLLKFRGRILNSMQGPQ